MIPTRNFSSRGGQRVRLVTLHTTEGARDVDSLGAYFQKVTNVSYHGAFDDQRFEAYVDYSNAAYSIRNGNPITDNAAFCAFAAWSRAEWLQHPRMLELSAAWVAERCTARGLPIRRLSTAETAAAVRDPKHPGGVIMHRDYTYATGDGTHTDCGDGLPWDVILPRAQQLAGHLEDDMAIGFEGTFEDLYGHKDASILNTYRWNEKRLADLAGDGDKAAAKRGDLGYMRDQLRGDVSALDKKFTEQVTNLAGELAEIKALLLGKAPTT
jgi:hypothetical protein